VEAVEILGAVKQVSNNLPAVLSGDLAKELVKR
jgi:hypothetical protein